MNTNQSPKKLHLLTEDKTWEDIWMACALAGQPHPDARGFATSNVADFPDAQINLIFQSTDSDKLGPRIQVLVGRVTERFSPSSKQPDRPGHPEVTGVLRLLERIYEQRRNTFSALDHARLLGVMGMLCRHHTQEGSHQMRRFWQGKGLEYLEEAATLGKDVPAGLQRHLDWLIADTMIGQVDPHGLVVGDRDEEKIVSHLIKACRGDPLRATEGLYFSCISRLFTLSPRAREWFTQELLSDLRRAWCVLSAASIKDKTDICIPATSGEEAQISDGPRLTKVADFFRTTKMGELRTLLDGLLDWHVEDRFAVCTLLAWHAGLGRPSPEHYIYGYEAASLLDKLKDSRLHRPSAPDVIIHHVRQLLAAAGRMRGIRRPDLQGVASVARTGSKQAQKLIETGDVEGAERMLHNEARSTTHSVQRYMCRLKIAELWGDANDARKERWLIEGVLLDCLSDENRYDAMVRAEAHRLLARNAAFCNLPQDVEKWLSAAQTSVGAAATPHLACVANSLLFRLRKDCDIQLGERPIQGQFVWLSMLWDNESWIEGPEALNLRSYLRPAPARDEALALCTGPRAFNREVQSLPRKASSDVILALAQKGLGIEPGNLLVPWTGGLVNIYERAANQSIRDQVAAYRLMNDRTEHLLELLKKDLEKGRAIDFRERLAIVLCKRLRILRLNQDRLPFEMVRQDERIAIEAIVTAIQLCQMRIRLSSDCSRSRQNFTRRRLRSLLRAAAEAGCIGQLGISVGIAVNDCKTTDAHLVHFEAEKDAVIEDFEDLSLLVPDEDELDRARIPGVVTKEDLSNRPTTVILNYFLPGDVVQENDSAAFVVVSWRGQGRNDEIIPLPGLQAAMRNFRKALRAVSSQYQKDSGLPPPPGKGPGTDLGRIPRLLSELWQPLGPDERHPMSGNNSNELNQTINELQTSLFGLGMAVLPENLRHLLRQEKNWVIAPDGRLFMIPLHVLPYDSTERTLLDDGINVSYKPRSDYGLGWSAAAEFSGMHTTVNLDDAEFSAADGFEKLVQSIDDKNEWPNIVSPQVMLERMAAVSVSVVLTHGHSNAKHELVSRVTLKDGRCLTTLDILQAPQRNCDFKRSSVYFFACNTMPQRTSVMRDLLGPAGAFLTCGVGSVSASLWKCQIKDAIAVAQYVIDKKPSLDGAPSCWSDALRQSSLSIRCPLDRFVRLGCFVLYTSR